ncbi:MAG: hypothetical protein KQJ78_17395 [Deltaproteobacteria bacterium]|nr:hypothetical protein [Deltaproteobacteria bacterium]
MPKVVIFILFLALAAGMLWWAGAWRFSSQVGRFRRRLWADAGLPPLPDLDSDAARALPPPVLAYFQKVLPPGRVRPIIGAELTQNGFFRLEPESPWLATAGRQDFVARPPGFFWGGQVQLSSWLDLEGWERYHARRGEVRGSFLGLVPLLAHAGPEADRSELLHWLAGAVWAPSALWPGQGLSWEAGPDPESARVILEDGPLQVSGVFRFRVTGELESFTTEGRCRFGPEGRPEPLPWRMRYGQWQQYQGWLLPGRAEAAWLPPGGALAHLRVELTSIQYEFSEE